MSKVRVRYIILGLIVSAGVVLSALFVHLGAKQEESKLYRVEMDRAARQIEAQNVGTLAVAEAERVLQDIAGQYPNLDRIVRNDGQDRFFDSETTYSMFEIDGALYRIDYVIGDDARIREVLHRMDLVLVILGVLVLVFLLYVFVSIIAPFSKVSKYPEMLAKGNLTAPLTQSKSPYFRKFVWGLDMLRETLQAEREKNLEFTRDRNVMLLSLSHDLKTPLSAIKLYSAALKRNLYEDPEQKQHSVEQIAQKADEIEGYVSKLVQAAGEDFLDFTVRQEEFFLADVVEEIRAYYKDKLRGIGTEFVVEDYPNRLLRGDRDRLVEVLQNLMENAIKYGDGRRIALKYSTEDGASLLTVANTGKPVPEGEAEHIFDSFYRGSNVGTRPGSGLGLYISRKLMHRMGGEVFANATENGMEVTVVLVTA